jgi:hypothetical protein
MAYRARAPLHQGSALGGAGARTRRRACSHHSQGRRAEPDQSAAGMSLSHALPVRIRSLSERRTAASLNGERTVDRMSPRNPAASLKRGCPRSKKRPQRGGELRPFEEQCRVGVVALFKEIPCRDSLPLDSEDPDRHDGNEHGQAGNGPPGCIRRIVDHGVIVGHSACRYLSLALVATSRCEPVYPRSCGRSCCWDVLWQTS